MPTTALLTRPAYADVVRNMPGLIGYWRLGDRLGTVARDELNAKNGTYVGSPTLGSAGLLTGDGDAAVTFNTGKYATLPALALSSAQARTIAVWAALTGSYFSQFKTLFVYGTVGTSGIFYIPGGATPGTGNTGNLRVFDGGVDMSANPAVGPLLADGSVHLCAAVYNGTGWAFSLDASTLGSPITGAAGASVTPTIGRWNTTNDWIGRLDDTAVWNRALSNNEIRTLYLAGRAQ